MAEKPERKPEVVNAATMNKYLMGVITGIRTKEVTVEETEQISKIADKIVKLNLTRIMYMKAKNSELPIDFFEPSENSLLINK